MFEREERGVVRVLRMVHGKASALDIELLDGLAAEIANVNGSGSRAMVLTGRGAIFSAGVDLLRLRDGGADYVREFLPALERAFLALFSMELPVVAAVNGHAIAGGCVLACACDRRLMARGKGRIGVPELQVGVPFPILASEIVRRVATHADDVLLGGATFTPEEALERSLVDELVDSEALLDRAVEDAQALAKVPATSFALTKRSLRQSSFDFLEQHRATLDAEIARAWESDEVLEAIGKYASATLGK